MCKVLKVSCTGFYSWLKRPESRRCIENRLLEQKIREIYQASRKIYGAPKIHEDLNDQGIPCSLNRVARIMRQAGIKSKTVKKFKATTDSRHNFPVAPNLLNQNFDVSLPNKAWVADITFIPTAEGWLSNVSRLSRTGEISALCQGDEIFEPVEFHGPCRSCITYTELGIGLEPKSRSNLIREEIATGRGYQPCASSISAK